jgi:multidrug efflux system membrane fusion protein
MKTRSIIWIALAGIMAAGCGKSKQADERPTPVEVQSVQAFSGMDTKRFSAVIQPYEQVELPFRVGGYVDTIARVPGLDKRSRLIQDGDRVSSGMVLARLHAVDYSARVQQAKASVAEAETQMAKAELDRKRSTALFESQSLTKADYDAAKANHEAAQARFESAKGKLAEAVIGANDTVLRAPFAGTILKRSITTGTLASPGQPAFVIADTSAVKATFGVPDKLMPRMKIGNTLSMRTEAFSDVELKGRISRVSAAADTKSRVFEVEVTIPNAKDELKVGMIATLLIEDTVPEVGSRVIPIGALVSSTKRPGGYAVFVTSREKGQSVARLIDVELGRTLGNVVVLTSGPQVGEQIITTGAGLLRDGEPIEVHAGENPIIAKK